MNGILCVNKPEGFTSFDVIAKLRGILKMRRLGHGGTLDPLATGVLPVFVGKAARVCDIMPDSSKSYRAGFRLGVSSDTQDVTGEILTRSDMSITQAQIQNLLNDFTGCIKQLPPMYSAVKVGGRKLCDIARSGMTAERSPREVQVKSITIESYDEEQREGVMFIECSKGVYVRTLINDIGERLGCGGIMTSLVRTSSGGFSLEECHTLSEIQNAAENGSLEKIIVPTEYVFRELPALELTEIQTKKYRCGVKLRLSEVAGADGSGTYAVFGYGHRFIGTAFADREKNELKVGKNLSDDEELREVSGQ